MALLTQKAILSAFSQMLEEMPFDKITVSAPSPPPFRPPYKAAEAA